MRTYPVHKRLCPGGLRVCVIAGAQCCHKDLGLSDLSRPFVNYCNCMACIVNEKLFSGPVIESHGNINLAGPFFVIPAEPAVFITFRVSLFIFLP